MDKMPDEVWVIIRAYGITLRPGVYRTKTEALRAAKRMRYSSGLSVRKIKLARTLANGERVLNLAPERS